MTYYISCTDTELYMTICMDTEISHGTLVSVSELFLSSVTNICETIGDPGMLLWCKAILG